MATEDTQLILERLKREGDLLRNRGKHSIKSVKVDMSKFEPVFDTIALNLQEQTEILRESLGMERDRVAEEMRRRDLEELKVENSYKAANAPTSVGREKDKGGALGLVGGALGGVLGTLSKIAIVGATGFVAYNFLKGFMDSKYGAGFTDQRLDDAKETVEGLIEQAGRAPAAFGSFIDKVDDFLPSIDDAKQTITDLKTDATEIMDEAKETLIGEEGFFTELGNLTPTFGTLKTVIDDAKTEFDDVKKRITGEGGVLDRVEDTIDSQTAIVRDTIDTAKTAVEDAKTTLNNVTDVFSEVDFPNLKQTFGRISRELPPAANSILDFFSNPLAAILPPLTAGLVTGAVARQTGLAIAGLRPEYRQTGTINPAMNLKTAVIGAVGLGIGIFGERVKNWISSDDGLGLGNVDIGGINVGNFVGGAVDVLGMAAQGATLGAMFGPTGMLVGGIIGGIIGIGQKLWNWWQGEQDEIDEEIRRETAAATNRRRANRSRANRANPTEIPVIDQVASLASRYDQLQDQLAAADNKNNKSSQRLKSRISSIEGQAAALGATFLYQGGSVTINGGDTVGGGTVVESNQTVVAGGGANGGGESGAGFAN